ncbi:MAG: M23 family metallopeptidase, partial [Thaumarchaeota archaeon]|nr:M23 family metallopeptidase [Nitrososphaerota archaeon]
FYSFYAHLASVNVGVMGLRVIGTKDNAKGTIIGEVGSTGKSAGKHLHFEIRKTSTKDSVLDPCLFIDCTQSAVKKCEPGRVEYTQFLGLYNYYDEEANRFVPRPFELEFKAEDYLPVIDCRDIPDTHPTYPYKLYYWDPYSVSPDMICYMDELYICRPDDKKNIPKGPVIVRRYGEEVGDTTKYGFAYGCYDLGFICNGVLCPWLPAPPTPTSTPATCGNNIREGAEKCDGTDLAGNTCNSLGYAGGDLRCLTDCKFDESLCTTSTL